MFSYSCCFQLLFTIYGFKLSYQACHTTTKATSNSKKILITRKKKTEVFCVTTRRTTRFYAGSTQFYAIVTRLNKKKRY